MKRAYFLPCAGMLMLALLAACGPTPQPSPEAPAPSPVVAPDTQQPTQPPVETQAPAATATQTAPFCQEANTTAQCSSPQGEMIDKFCVKKVPYTLVAVPPGTRFEVLTPGFSCADSGVRGGSLVLTCTGKDLFTFDLKLTNPACAAPSGSDNGGCPQGYSYDAGQQCCAAAPVAGETGSVEMKVDIGTCPGPQ